MLSVTKTGVYMKKIITVAMALLSINSFAGGYDQYEMVTVSANTATEAFALAQDMAEQVNDAKFDVKLSFLDRCNPTSSDIEDRNFRRKAFASSSKVRLNHVTGVYTAIIDVRCED